MDNRICQLIYDLYAVLSIIDNVDVLGKYKNPYTQIFIILTLWC